MTGIAGITDITGITGITGMTGITAFICSAARGQFGDLAARTSPCEAVRTTGRSRDRLGARLGAFFGRARRKGQPRQAQPQPNSPACACLLHGSSLCGCRCRAECNRRIIARVARRFKRSRGLLSQCQRVSGRSQGRARSESWSNAGSDAVRACTSQHRAAPADERLYWLLSSSVAHATLERFTFWSLAISAQGPAIGRETSDSADCRSLTADGQRPVWFQLRRLGIYSSSWSIQSSQHLRASR